MKHILTTFFLFFNTVLFAGAFNAEVLNKESSFVVKHNVLYESNYVAIRINNSKGDDYGKIKIYYSEENPINDFDAWIEDDKGNKIRDIEKGEIKDKNNIQDIDLFDDNCLRSFELIYNTYPYVIKYKYSRKKKEFILICNWTPIYDPRIPTINSTLIVDIPKDYRIGKHESIVSKPNIDSSGKRIIYTWNGKYEKIIKPEIWCISLNELVPSVGVVPIEFKFGIEGSQSDWISYGNWVYNLNKGLDDLPETEIQKVKQLINGINDKRQIIKILYQYMQDNTRYVAVQIGIGGYKSFPASYVCNKEYGDCKALSNYMKALLKVAGIPSYCTLIYGGTNAYKINPDFVSATQFNHVILLVPLDKDSVWLECTSKVNPCGYLGAFTQNRYALVINENKSCLVKTPTLNKSNCYTISKRTMQIDSISGITLNATNTFSGEDFDYNLEFATQLTKDDQEKQLYNRLPYGNFEIKKWNIEVRQRDSSVLKMNYKLLLKNNLIKSGNYWSIRIEGFRASQFEPPLKRLLPVRITYPLNYIDSLTIILPNGYTAESMQDEDIETDYGQIKAKYIIRKTSVEVYRELLIKPCEIQMIDYPIFYRFINKYAKEADVQLTLRKDE